MSILIKMKLFEEIAKDREIIELIEKLDCLLEIENYPRYLTRPGLGS